MDDALGGSAGSSSVLLRRQVKNSEAGSFSPSYGVRNGYRADVERALPSGMQSARTHRRVPMMFEVCLDGQWRHVSGDVSGGGALVLLPFLSNASQIELSIRLPNLEWRGAGRIVHTDLRGERYGHHVQFADPAAAATLDAALQKGQP